jgi:hypothetical protein
VTKTFLCESEERMMREDRKSWRVIPLISCCKPVSTLKLSTYKMDYVIEYPSKKLKIN